MLRRNVKRPEVGLRQHYAGRWLERAANKPILTRREIGGECERSLIGQWFGSLPRIWKLSGGQRRVVRRYLIAGCVEEMQEREAPAGWRLRAAPPDC